MGSHSWDTRVGSLLCTSHIPTHRMKYPLVLAPLLLTTIRAVSEAGADPQNSLLTSRTLASHLNPVASPFGPLSPNGAAAAAAVNNNPANSLLHLPHPLDHHIHHRGTLHHQVPLGACSIVCSILDLLVFNPQFSTFISVIKAAGLVGLLSQPGPITLFVPTNEAFDHLSPLTFGALLQDKVALQALMLRHMTKGALLSPSLPPGPTPLITGAGERVTLTALPHHITVTSVLAIATVIDVDNEASNGVVHVVDAVF